MKNDNSKYWKNKAMKAWGEYIHLKYSSCAICGRSDGKLDAHHLISRKVVAFRNDPENGILLCFYCHKHDPRWSPHAGTLGFAEWLKENMPKKFQWWQENKNKIKRKIERKTYKEDYEYLKKLIEDFQNEK
jgi:hypothetical protein